MNRLQEKVQAYRQRTEEITRRYEAGTLFPESPFEGMSPEARAQGTLVKRLAESEGFKVLEANSTNSGFDHFLIGDSHYTKGDSEFLKYHGSIANIISNLIGTGMLKAGDLICAEGSRGIVNLAESTINGKGNLLVVKDFKNGKKETLKVDDRYMFVRLLPTLRKSGVWAVYNDAPEIAEQVLKADAEYKEKQTEALAFTRDALLLLSIEKGPKEFLTNTVAKASQVFGVIDLFSGIVQEALRLKGESYISLVPEDFNGN
jgi:hypothetical protein